MPKVICVGRNYAAHAAELGNKKPSEPVIFLKPETAILSKNKPFFIPDFSQSIHYECEMIVRINKLGKNIDVKFAHKYYSEISLGIDFTARDLQEKLKKEGLPWEIAKAFDNSAVVGKWVEKKEYNIGNMAFSLFINGEKKQQGTTYDMIFSIDELIAYISKFFTLKIGDIIFTGTPAGVGPVAQNDLLVGCLENQEVFNFRCK